MRRILLLITDLEIGGTPTVVRELAVRLTQMQGRDAHGTVEVEVACLSKWGPVAEELRAAGVTVHALAAGSVWDVPVIGRFISLVRRRGYDTVFSFLVHANAVAAIGRLLLRYRLIQSVQTTQPRPRWHWWVQRLVHGAAEKVAVPSRSARRVAWDRAGIPGEKIVVIPNAVDVDSFHKSEIPEQNPIPYPIGFIGRLDPVKRIPMLIRSLLLVKHKVHLHIFGEGRERGEILGAIERYGLKQNVTLHGVVSRPQEALEQIGLLVLPSIAEGFGLVLIEAMAASVPVVGTDVPGIRDIIKDNVTGLLVPVDDESALARAIDRIVIDIDLRRQLTARGREYVREAFNWERVMGMYRKLLDV